MSSPPLNPTSFRYPFELKDQPPEVVQAHRYAFQGLVDLNKAIVGLKQQVDGKVSTASTAPGTSTNTNVSTESITNITNLAGWPVNNRSGNTAYITAQSDNTTEIVLSSASAVAVALNQSVTLPWGCFLNNQGTGTVTVTPQLGTINGAVNLTLFSGYSAIVFFDGLDFWAQTAAPATGGGGNVPWTPSDQSGAALTFSSVSVGSCQAGNMVFVYGTLTFPSTSSSSPISIGGLPVAVSSSTYAQVNSGSVFIGNPTLVAFGSASPAIGGNSFGVFNNTGGSVTNSTASGTKISFNFSYPAV